MQRDDIAHGHFGDITFDWQRASILHRIEEDGCDLATQDKSAISLVRNVRDVIAHVPQHRVGGRFPR